MQQQQQLARKHGTHNNPQSLITTTPEEKSKTSSCKPTKARPKLQSRSTSRIPAAQKNPPKLILLSVCLFVSHTGYLKKKKKKKKRRRRSDTKDLHLALQNRSLESKTNHIQQKQQKLHLWLGKEEEYSAGSRITQRTLRVPIFVRVIANGKRVTGKQIPTNLRRLLLLLLSHATTAATTTRVSPRGREEDGKKTAGKLRSAHGGENRGVVKFDTR